MHYIAKIIWSYNHRILKTYQDHFSNDMVLSEGLESLSGVLGVI